MLNTIKNPYVSVAMTDDLRDNFIEAYNANKPNIPERIKILAENKFKSDIQLEDILWLKKKLPKDVRIYKLLENCDVKLPAPELEPRNPELEARIQKLKVLEEERRYQDMTRNVDTSRVRHPEDSIAYQMKEMNRQLIGVLQVVLSISTGFAFGFIGINWLIGPLEVSVRLVLGLVSAFVIGTAELYFFVKKIAETLDPPPATNKKKI
ncbi:uncharacterized protein LOC135847258 isoform X1 [Planococcus citri]|uniref:uncharacterized protein LOC135847258 isoform X1 n=1 Tax=Planococcus citri TaxID=170843 RepID=UPI0031F82782